MMQALHRHCHDRMSADEGSLTRRWQHGIVDKDHTAEEPDDANVLFSDNSMCALVNSRSRYPLGPPASPRRGAARP